MSLRFNPLRASLTLGLIVAAGIATPASAKTQTRLVDCAAGSCLVVTGQRADSAALVSINGHAVAVEGAHKWRASVPVETLREWSEPFARTIAISVADSPTEAVLPIGLLGHIDNLAFLTISAK